MKITIDFEGENEEVGFFSRFIRAASVVILCLLVAIKTYQFGLDGLFQGVGIITVSFIACLSVSALIELVKGKV